MNIQDNDYATGNARARERLVTKCKNEKKEGNSASENLK